MLPRQSRSDAANGRKPPIALGQRFVAAGMRRRQAGAAVEEQVKRSGSATMEHDVRGVHRADLNAFLDNTNFVRTPNLILRKKETVALQHKTQHAPLSV